MQDVGFACYDFVLEKNKLKYICSKKKDVVDILLLEIIQNTSGVCCFCTQSLGFLFCSHVSYFKEESATSAIIHLWKFAIGSQAQPFTSTVRLVKEEHLAGEEVTSSQQGKKRFYIFIVVSA